jgi:integrase
MTIYKRGATYWFTFVFNGRRIQRSTKQRNRKAAIDIEGAYRTQLAKGEVGLDETKKDVTIGQLLDALETDFKLRGKWDARNESNFKCARAVFPATMNAESLTSEDVDAYIVKKQREGLAPATINRMVQLVGQAYKKGLKRKDIKRMPEMRHLSEKGNERKGFFETEEFARLLEHLPEDLHDFCRFAYITGWRKSEIASLTWADVEGDVVRLRGENAKNGEARSVVLAGELAEVIKRRRQVRLSSGVLTDTVFHREGNAIAEFRKSWASASIAAGLGSMVCPKCGDARKQGDPARCPKCRTRRQYSGRIFHDFRRTAVRNMVRSGVPQSIAMKISGHKTASMFRRYDISNEDDLREALLRVESYQKSQQQKVVAIVQ